MPMIRLTQSKELSWILLFIIFIIGSTILIPLYHHSSQTMHLKTWLDSHDEAFFIWRMGLILLIFLVWPIYIQYKTAGKQLSILQRNILIQRRYYIVVLLAGLNALFSLGSWL